MQLQHKTALVTGGAIRIGRAISEALVDAGCRVVIHYRTSESEANALASDLNAGKAGSAWLVRAALDTGADCEQAFAAACEQAGHLDILVNNAAVFAKADLWETTEDDLLAQLRPNLFAPLFLMRAFARHLRTRREKTPALTGSVVNLLDRRVASDDPGCVPYLLAKKGLAALTRTAALSLAPDIRVNGVAPGPVLPPIGLGQAYLEDHAGAIPLRDMPQPQHVAQAVLFLARCDSVTGQILFVDGGQHLLGNALA